MNVKAFIILMLLTRTESTGLLKWTTNKNRGWFILNFGLKTIDSLTIYDNAEMLRRLVVNANKYWKNKLLTLVEICG